jgi:hypothetical protein
MSRSKVGGAYTQLTEEKTKEENDDKSLARIYVCSYWEQYD